jgi:hypothetical protein
MVDLGFMFNDGDDEQRDIVVFKVDAFHCIGVFVILKQGQETFGDVLDVSGLHIVQHIDLDEIS